LDNTRTATANDTKVQRTVVRAETTSRRQEIYRDAIHVIARDYARDLTVEDVAHSVATSRRQLQRVLEEVGGVSFRDILTRVRMTHAARLLRETTLPVATVAHQVGYRQPAQFAKTFRRLYGQVPSAYRTSPQPVAAAPHPLGVAARLVNPAAGDRLAAAAAPAR
jgi:AraC family transcriptional regulator of adaptative response / methylphosphotriester-DNA alkyltransferase methyltransferase